MSKIDDRTKAVQEHSGYIDPENFFSTPPSKEIIKRWTESLTGFRAQDTISPEVESDLNEICCYYYKNKQKLEQYAADLDVQPIGQSTPKEVLFMIYIRTLQSRYAGRANLNSHKFDNLMAGKYSVENIRSQTSKAENHPTKEMNPGILQEIDTTRRDSPDSEEIISYESSKIEQAEATNIHEQTVEVVSAYLEKKRWNCKKTEETDILATRDEQVLVAEVKYIDRQNERRQIRKALGQLHENCYRDVIQRGWSKQTLIASLVLSQRPSDPYRDYLKYLCGRDIETLWVKRDEVSGLQKSINRVS